MDLMTLIGVVLVVIVARLVYSRSRGPGPGPEWRRSWRELPLRERWRIARGAQRGTEFDEDEAALAAGAAQLQQRMVYFPLGTWVVLLIAIAMTVAVAAVGNFKPAAFGVVVVGLLAWRLFRSHRTRRNLARTAAVSPDLPREQA